MFNGRIPLESLKSVSATTLVAQRLSPYLPAFSVAVIWLGVLFILTWLSAEWFWRANAPDPVVLSTQTISDPLVAAQSIVSRHLMGDSPRLAVNSSAQLNDQFQLTGAMTASKGRLGFAILSEDGKIPVPVLEGEELAPGIVLFKVFATGVEIRRQGHTEFLELNDKAAPNSAITGVTELGTKITENVPAPASGSRTH